MDDARHELKKGNLKMVLFTYQIEVISETDMLGGFLLVALFQLVSFG